MRISDWSSDVCSSDRKNRHAGAIGIFAGFRDFSHDIERPVFGDLHIDAGGAQYLLVQQDFRNLILQFSNSLALGRYIANERKRDKSCIADQIAVRKGIKAIGRNSYLITSIQRSEEHTSELQSLMRISYAVFCLKKKNTKNKTTNIKKHTHLI